MQSMVWKELFDGLMLRSFINGDTRAETSVIDGAIRDNFAIRGGMKEEFISRKFKDGI